MTGKKMIDSNGREEESILDKVAQVLVFFFIMPMVQIVSDLSGIHGDLLKYVNVFRLEIESYRKEKTYDRYATSLANLRERAHSLDSLRSGSTSSPSEGGSPSVSELSDMQEGDSLMDDNLCLGEILGQNHGSFDLVPLTIKNVEIITDRLQSIMDNSPYYERLNQSIIRKIIAINNIVFLATLLAFIAIGRGVIAAGGNLAMSFVPLMLAPFAYRELRNFSIECLRGPSMPLSTEEIRVQLKIANAYTITDLLANSSSLIKGIDKKVKGVTILSQNTEILFRSEPKIVCAAFQEELKSEILRRMGNKI